MISSRFKEANRFLICLHLLASLNLLETNSILRWQGIKRAGLRLVALDGKTALKTATLTSDNSGRLLLPAQILRVLGMQPGIEMKVEVSRGRIELLGEQEDDVPLITELSPEGKLVFPAGVKPPLAEKIVTAIKTDRKDRINKLSRR